MNRYLFAVLLLMGFAAQAEESLPQDPANGAELMQRVQAALPEIPIDIKGSIVTRDHRGKNEKKYKVTAQFRWGEAIPSTSYTLLDDFSTPLLAMKLSWPQAGASARLEYREGKKLELKDAPALTSNVLDTDFTWNDLTLAFLQWPDPKYIGKVKHLNRICYVLDLPAPDGAGGGARLWIDAATSGMLKAEQYGKDAKLERSMEVETIAKMNGMWTLENLEVVTHTGLKRHKSVLKISEMKQVDQKPAEK